MVMESVRRAFEEMDDSRLLATAAFFSTEYSPEALEVLRQITQSRGFTEADIRRHREESYPEMNLEVRCAKCKTRLLLERDDFVNGEFTCPECDTWSHLDYSEIKPPASELDILMRLACETGVFGIIGFASDGLKSSARREGILDGTYWKDLKDAAEALSKKDS